MGPGLGGAARLTVQPGHDVQAGCLVIERSRLLGQGKCLRAVSLRLCNLAGLAQVLSQLHGDHPSD
jgi:hypothetical protein